MIIKMYPQNPNPRHVDQVVNILRSGGVIIYPTDTVYGLGCDMYQHKAIEKMAMIKGIQPERATFSLLVPDLSNLADYTRPINNSVFKLMRKNLPGPFTFILPAGHNVPRLFKGKKKTIGIRVPDNPIILEIIRALGNPILTTSIRDEDEVLEYTTDPELIHEKYGRFVDMVIDGGYGHNIASTVIDCTGEEPVIIREGLKMPEL